MRFGLFFILSLGLAPALGQAATLNCADKDRSVQLTAKLNKHLGEPHDLQVWSGGKSKPVKREDIKQVRSNASGFYLVFIVQTKNGREEFELNTQFKAGNQKASAGVLTNKTDSEQVPISCSFTT